MSYASAVAGLLALSGELHTKPGAPRRKFDLAEMRVLAESLGSPHTQFRSVLIAGTNGKGSTSSTLAAILRAAGYRVGLYTSPHLTRVNERIRIDGRDIADDAFAAYYFRVDDCARKLVAEGRLSHHPSFFEAMTAVAFLAFAEANLDIAVLEVGMGGRLDATNIVEPMVSVITDISLDHMEWLGDTIAKIAREKAGIMRPNGILVTLPQHPEANETIGEVAVSLNVRGVNAAEYVPPRTRIDDTVYSVTVLGEQIEVASPLTGAHQQRNIALAIATAVELQEHYGYRVTAAEIAEGIRKTRWPGRLERFHKPGRADVILDAAHNPAGAWALRSALSHLQPPEDKEQSATAEGGPLKRSLSGEQESHTSTAGSGPSKRSLGGGQEVHTSAVESGEQQDFDAWTPSPMNLVFGCLKDKAYTEIAQILFPMFDNVILTEVNSPRTTSLADLKTAAESTGASVVAAANPKDALTRALAMTPPDGLLVVAGSIYLIGELRPELAEPAVA